MAEYSSDSEDSNIHVTGSGNPQADGEEGIGDELKDALNDLKGQPANIPLVVLLEALAERSEGLGNLLEKAFSEYRKAKEIKARHQFRMAMIACLVVLGCVGVAAWLTHEGHIEGSTFGFFLGLVIGYILTFLRDSIGPPAAERY